MDQSVSRPLTIAFRWSLCKILNPNGVIVGAGLAIDQATVLTCAHVIGDALLGDKYASLADIHQATEKYGNPKVRRAFPRSADETGFHIASASLGEPIAEIADFAGRSTPEGPRDLALLHLPELASEEGDAQLPPIFDEPIVGEQLKALGFPPDAVERSLAGVANTDSRVAELAPGGIYLLGKDRTGDDSKIRGGFSGAPAWSSNRGGIVGLIVDGDVSLGTGAILPIAMIRDFLARSGRQLPTDAGADFHEHVEKRSLQARRLHRAVLDSCLPRAHLWLTRNGVFEQPDELHTIQQHLSAQIAKTERELAEKTYIPPPTVEAPQEAPTVQFQPVRQAIRLIAGVSTGGDSTNATVSALSRKSRAVRDLVRLITGSRDPIILLGEPGAGKSITLQQAVYRVAQINVHKVYPTVTILVPLGRWERIQGRDPTAEDVDALVRRFCPQMIEPYLDALAEQRRLFVLFDGMDEMSRSGYVAHTAALSDYATQRRILGIRTLFSCRIADFSPNFQHRRLVLMPFGRLQIRQFLRRQFQSSNILLDGEQISIRRLVDSFDQLESSLQISNPYVLYLLCHYISRRESIPSNRTTLLRHYYEERTRAKLVGEFDVDSIFTNWGSIAFAITNSDSGGEVVEADLREELDRESAKSIHLAVRIGLLERSLDGDQDLPARLRFENHRAQEYFTAWHLVSARHSIDWQSRLDSQRWQETLVNVAQMGDADSIVAALSATMEEDAHAAGMDGSLLAEARIAERVDLSSRVLLNMPPSDSRNRLAEDLRGLVGELIAEGNPSSQSMALGAVQRTPEIARFSTIRPALLADTRWVRSQAHVIAPVISGERSGEALAEDIMYNYGQGTYFRQVPSFVKVALKTRAWRPLVLSVLALLVLVSQMALTAVTVPLAVEFAYERSEKSLYQDGDPDVALGRLAEIIDQNKVSKPEIAEKASNFSMQIERQKTINLSLYVIGWVSIFASIIGIIISILYSQQLHWIMFFANICISIVVPFYAYILWEISDTAPIILFVLSIWWVGALFFAGLSVLMLIIMGIAMAMTVPLFLIALAFSRSRKVAMLPFSTLQSGAGFDEARETLREAWFEETSGALWFPIIASVGIVLYNLIFDAGSDDPTWLGVVLSYLKAAYEFILSYRIELFSWFTRFGELVFTLWLTVTPTLFLCVFLFRDRSKEAKARLGPAIAVASGVTMFAGFFIVLSLLASFLQSFFDWIGLQSFFDWIGELLGEGAAVYIFYAVLGIAVLILAWICVVLAILIYKRLLPYWRQLYSRFNESAVDAEWWVQSFKSASVENQAALCSIVSPARFSLTAEETLQVLEKVKDDVGPDPAKSAYFQVVANILKIMRQDNR